MGGPGSGRKKGSSGGKKTSNTDAMLMRAYKTTSKTSLKKIGKKMAGVEKAIKNSK